MMSTVRHYVRATGDELSTPIDVSERRQLLLLLLLLLLWLLCGCCSSERMSYSRIRIHRSIADVYVLLLLLLHSPLFIRSYLKHCYHSVYVLLVMQYGQAHIRRYVLHQHYGVGE